MTTLSNEALAKELLPCPFCGGDDITVDHAGRDTHYFVQCNDCDVIQDYDHGYTKAEAITAWNTRTPPVREDVLEEAANRARGMLRWRLKGHELRDTLPDRVAEDILSLKHRKTTPPEPADEGAWVVDPQPEIIGDPLCKIVSYNQAHEVAVEMGYPSLTEALEHLDELRAPTTPENSELVTQAGGVGELVELREFLDGSGSLDGLFFGDAKEGCGKARMARAQFWWRDEMNRRIDRTLSTITSLQATVSRLEAALTRLVTFFADYCTVPDGLEIRPPDEQTNEHIADAMRLLEPTTKYGRGSTGPENGEG